MTELSLHSFHAERKAVFTEVNGMEVVEHYGDWKAEHDALTHRAGVLDLGSRSRICLTGADRQRFLNGQVTNNVKDLKPGTGCYAALVNAKGRMESDLNIYCLSEEVLLDFEPGLAPKVTERFERFVIADDVQVVDVAPHYGHLRVQGPKATDLIQSAGIELTLPTVDRGIAVSKLPDLGEVYCAKRTLGRDPGLDIFVPQAALGRMASALAESAERLQGRLCGWRALEVARIEAGTPRFGADMDESNLAPEAGIESSAISYSKGCYIGQEIIARIRTYGQVSKALRGLLLPDALSELELPERGDKLLHSGAEIGYITSRTVSPRFQKNIALGYVRRECNQPGTELLVRAKGRAFPATIVELPFQFDYLPSAHSIQPS